MSPKHSPQSVLQAQAEWEAVSESRVKRPEFGKGNRSRGRDCGAFCNTGISVKGILPPLPRDWMRKLPNWHSVWFLPQNENSNFHRKALVSD